MSVEGHRSRPTLFKVQRLAPCLLCKTFEDEAICVLGRTDRRLLMDDTRYYT